MPKNIGTETFANLAKIKKQIAKINLILKLLLFLGHKYGIRYKRGLKVFRPDKTVATADHNVPTIDQHLPIKEALSRNQVDTLNKNCNEHGIDLYGLGHKYQGIVHVIGPELGITQPGMTIVCGDSHTSTHGAFGSIAFGIGTSEVEMVLSTQCLLQNKPKTMLIEINGELSDGVYSKDIILFSMIRVFVQSINNVLDV